MASVRLHDDNRRIASPGEAARFLAGEGIVARNWDVSGLRGALKDNYALQDAEKEEILAAFRDEVARLKAEGGYVTADVVILWENTPNLPAVLDNFRREHHHSEDEVRFVVDGHGIFAIRGKSGRYFDVEVGPGDLINVPAGTRHWFTLAADSRIKCIRLFQDPSGWAAIYEERAAAR